MEKERETLLRDLMENNAGCSLPCWWGITPGKTIWQEAERFFLEVGARVGASSIADSPGSTFRWIDINFEGEPLYGSLGFVEHEHQIDKITVLAYSDYNPLGIQSLWDHYSPKQVMETYHVPSQILLRAPGVSGVGTTGRTGYILWIFYDHLGFMIRYDGSVRDLPIFHFCPTIDQINQIEIDMQSPDASFQLEQQDGILTSEYYEDTIKTIEEAAGMTVEEFYRLFTQSKEPACFDSPHDIWPKR